MAHRVLVSIPAYDCKVSVPTCQSLVHSIAIASHKHAINVSYTCGNAIIARARNMMVAEFMAMPQYDTLFMIDADIGWQPEAFKRLIELPEELVGGIYPYRSDEGEGKFPARFVDSDKKTIIGNENGLVEVRGLPGGFLRIRRSAIEKLQAAYPQRYVADTQAPTGGFYVLFSNEQQNGTFVGEDYYFCDLWRQIGGKCWADPDVNFEHMGVKSWRGNLAKTMKKTVTVVGGDDIGGDIGHIEQSSAA